MRDDDHDPLADRGAGQVVQQAQAGLVGVVGVVDDEHCAAAGGREPQQFGGADEQPLVAALAGPLRGGAAQRPLDLDAVLVGQAVEQGRVPPA